jgi:uncharacterized membrane protein
MTRLKLSTGNLVLGIVGTLDLASTLYLLLTGRMVEGNSIMSWVLAKGLVWFVVVKLLSYIPAVYILQWYRGRNLAFSVLMTRCAILGYILAYVIGVLVLNR